jgi:hypothetical protein
MPIYKYCLERSGNISSQTFWLATRALLLPPSTGFCAISALVKGFRLDSSKPTAKSEGQAAKGAGIARNKHPFKDRDGAFFGLDWRS